MRSGGNRAEFGHGLRKARLPSDGGERRFSERFAESAVGVITYQCPRRSTSCRVLNISASGARLELDIDDLISPIISSHGLPGSFTLMVVALGFEAQCTVAWRSKATLGVKFNGRVRPLPRQFRKRRAF